MDTFFFGCASVDHLNIEDDAYDGLSHFSQVSTYDDRKRNGYIRNHFVSYELDYDEDYFEYPRVVNSPFLVESSTIASFHERMQ